MLRENLRENIKLIAGICTSLNNNSLEFSAKGCVDTQMGLIYAALTGRTSGEFRLFVNSQTRLHSNHNWKGWLIAYWPINSTSELGVFNRLYKSGFCRDDIMYFEYLSDPLVLREFKPVEIPIFKEIVKTRLEPKFKYFSYYEDEYRTDFWGKLWGLKRSVKIDVPVDDGFEEIKYTEKEPNGFETVPRSLNPRELLDTIIYLNKWVEVYTKIANNDRKKLLGEMSNEQIRNATLGG